MQYYWREKLTKKEQHLYDKLVDAFYNYAERITCANFSFNKLNKIYIAITNDHPELYYLPSKVQVVQTMSVFGVKSELILHNLFNKSQIYIYDSVLEKIKADFSKKIRFCKNDFEKEKFVCEYIIENTTYQINNLLNQNVATVLVDKIGQCSGIAKATKLLLNWCGINTIVVTGSAKNIGTGQIGSHAWNIVQIDNHSYHLDVTFMLGANERKVKPYNLCYYNCTDREMNETHEWTTGDTPICNYSYDNASSSSFVYQTNETKADVVCTSFELCQLLENTLAQGKTTLSFESQIAVASNNLMAVIQNCCQKTMNKFSLNISMKIKIQGVFVQIKW